MSSPFRSLEAFPGLRALLPFWRKRAGAQFALFRALCLDPMQTAAEIYPCPLAAHCNYRIIRQPGQRIAGQCERDPRVCDVITFTEEDVTPLEFNWQKFALALCKAFNFESRFLKLPIPQTA